MRGTRRQGQHRRLVHLRDDSPLRRVDPRAKLALVFLLTATVMLPLERLLLFLTALLGLLWATRLIEEAARAVYRARWTLLVLFVADWLWIDLPFAAMITLRMLIVLAVSSLLMATTTPEEFRLALLALRLPYRYAFALSLAFQSLPLIQAEWLTIREAQQARGVTPPAGERRSWRAWLAAWSALTVPAIVLTTRRAWALTEAAHARGLGSPHYRPFRTLHMLRLDWAILFVAAAALGAFWLIR